MKTVWRETLRVMFMSGVVAGVLSGFGLAAAVEIGEEAPDFSLPPRPAGRSA